ncbi:MAG: VCBS repeat-containing protein, partial [Planctomycetes bacterium]|nr:VCBS repeat-containing protein [Planctomycetota bacterium]
MLRRSPRALPALVVLVVTGSLQSPALADPPWFSPWGRFAPTSNTTPASITLFDLNGDGRLDVVAGKGTEFLVGLGDGSGRFTISSVPLSIVPFFATAPVVARFDGDAFPDAVLVDNQTAIGRTFLGDGVGGFGGGPNTPLMSNVVEAKVVDVDGDGRSELYYLGFDAKTAVVRLNTAWTPVAALPQMQGSYRALAHGDFDGDGDVDLLTGIDGASIGTLRVLKGNGGTAFTVGPTTPLTMTLGAGSRMRVSDVDSDGDVDLVFSVASALWIARNGGSGAFAVDASPVATAAHWELTDVDGDDDDDLVLARPESSAVRLETRLNDGSGSFVAVADSFVLPTNLRSLLVERIDGDAALDLVFLTSQAGLPAEDALISCARGRGDGSWGLPAWTVPQTGVAHALGVVDFDADGDGDVVRAGLGNLVSFENTGDGSFVVHSSLPAIASGTVEFVDLDQDGLTDALLAGNIGDVATQFGIQVVKNVHGALQSSSVAHATNPGTIANGVDLTTGDFDGDGDVDAYVAAQSVAGGLPVGATSLRVLVNQAGVLAIPAGAPPTWPMLDDSLEHVRSGDVDNDGDLDLVVGNRQFTGTKNDVVLLFGDGQGGFAQGPILPIDVSYLDRSLHVLDVDGDGFLDVVGNDDIVPTAVLYGTGGGAFATPSVMGLPGPSRDMRFADFDSDGRVDVASIASSGKVRMSSQIAPRSFVTLGFVPAGTALADLVATDVDGDGLPDLVATRSEAPHPVLLTHRCEGAAAPIANACAGSGGFAPSLTVQRCPVAGSAIEFTIDDALGGTRGFLLISTGVTPIPFKTGCALDLNFPVTKVA